MNIENQNINNYNDIRQIDDDQGIPEVYESNPKKSKSKILTKTIYFS